MILPIRLRALAEWDVERAKEFYEERQAGLGLRFLDRLNEALERIQLMPESYGIVAKGVRVKLLRKFPYVVYYRVLPTEIQVLAVLHGRRDDAEWKARAGLN